LSRDFKKAEMKGDFWTNKNTPFRMLP